MPAYSPECAATQFVISRDFIAPLLCGEEIASGSELQERLTGIKGNRFAKAALDMAWWDLNRLIFDKRELPHWGRIERNLSAVRQDMTERLHRLYLEYQRVARILVLNPPANVLARHFHEIRLQEIAAYFDAISGGYWGKKTRGEK